MNKPNPWNFDLNDETKTKTVEESNSSSTNIFNFDTIKKRRGIKMLIYGPPGSGKTRFCLTSEDPIFIIDTENAARVFKGASFLEGKDIKGLNVFNFNPKKIEMDSVKILKEIEKVIYPITKDENIKTIAVDSSTSIWKYIQDWLRWKIVKTGGKINRKNVPVDRRDWARANSKYDGIMTALLSSDSHVILTAQQGEEYDSKGNKTGNLKPRVQKHTPFWVDIVVRLWRDIIKNEYYGIIEKCRYPIKDVLGKKIKNPTFLKVKEIIEEGEMQ